MRKQVIRKNADGTTFLGAYAEKSLKANGTYIPDVLRVIYNLKTTETVPVKDKDGKIKTETILDKNGNPRKDRYGNPVVKNVTETIELEKPVLSTSVFWVDGTVTRVKNSAGDRVETVMKKLSNGTEVKVASDASKELGLVHAVVKRTCGIPDEKTGEIDGTGYGRILNQIVGNAYDQNFEDAKAKVVKAEAKAAHQKRQAEAVARKKIKKYTDNDIRQSLGKLLDAVTEKAESDPKFLDKFMKALGA